MIRGMEALVFITSVMYLPSNVLHTLYFTHRKVLFVQPTTLELGHVGSGIENCLTSLLSGQKPGNL